MLGRVSSLDWLISIGLLPLSFALTGPVAAGDRRARHAHRRRAVGAAATLAALFLPRMRDLEERSAERSGPQTQPAAGAVASR